MSDHVPHKVIIVIDGEFGATEPDSAILDLGACVYRLLPDGINYKLDSWWHYLNGYSHAHEPGFVFSRNTVDWWFHDARASHNPTPGAIAYIRDKFKQTDSYFTVTNYHHRAMLLDFSSFICKVLEGVPRTEWCIYAKGPDTDAIILNRAMAFLGIEFNLRFARFRSIRDALDCRPAFQRRGFLSNHPSRIDCPIVFAPADYYLGDYQKDSELPPEERPAWYDQPPATPHVALYDAWLEGCEAVEHNTALNLMALGD